MSTTVTCHTDGCPNEDVPIPMDLEGTDDEGNPWAVSAVVCGPCGQAITDLGSGTLPDQITNEGEDA